MARRFARVSEEEIVAIKEAAFPYPSDLVNTITTIPLRVGEERWIYTSTLCVMVYISTTRLLQRSNANWMKVEMRDKAWFF